MRSFVEIHAVAAARKGGADALEHALSIPVTGAELAALPLSHWLSAMAKAVFQAGFNWQVVEAKWPGFSDAFEGFDPVRIAGYHHEHLDRLLADKRVIRNGAKLASVIDNARFLTELDAEHAGASAHLAAWPSTDFTGLVALFDKRGSRLGGVTGQRVCRMVGKDSFVLSGDVVKRLIIEGVIDKPPGSAKSMAAVQAAFNVWLEESGRPLTQISQILAMSVD